ncbi:MAG: hypothetical protein ACRCU2_03560 [Planktothrix sp.]
MPQNFISQFLNSITLGGGFLILIAFIIVASLAALMIILKQTGGLDKFQDLLLKNASIQRGEFRQLFNTVLKVVLLVAVMLLIFLTYNVYVVYTGLTTINGILLWSVFSLIIAAIPIVLDLVKNNQIKRLIKRLIRSFVLLLIILAKTPIKFIYFLEDKMIKNFSNPAFLGTSLFLAGFSTILIYLGIYDAAMAGAGASVAAAMASVTNQRKSEEEEEKELIVQTNQWETARDTWEIVDHVQHLAKRALLPDEGRDLIDLIYPESQRSILAKRQELEAYNQRLEMDIARLESKKELEYLRAQNKLLEHNLRNSTIFSLKKIDENNQQTSGFPEQYLGYPTNIEKINDGDE